MAETRTGTARRAFADEFTADVVTYRQHLEEALAMARALEEDLKGIQGGPSFFRAAGHQLELMCESVDGKRDEIVRKFTGEDSTEPELMEMVDHDLAAAAIAAKEG